jgi:dsDNA-specific endonuclease/ATPase MutS2
MQKLLFKLRTLVMNTDEQVKQAQANFRTITDLKGKLEILTGHVETRKETLEEEIEEKINEAIRNARDCLERVQENIEPKLESIIRDRLDILKIKMDRFTDEGLRELRKEIDKQTPVLTQKVLEEVDGLVSSKLMMARNELSQSIDQKIQAGMKAALTDYRMLMDKKYYQLMKISLTALGFSLVGLGVFLSINL